MYTYRIIYWSRKGEVRVKYVNKTNLQMWKVAKAFNCKYRCETILSIDIINSWNENVWRKVNEIRKENQF